MLRLLVGADTPLSGVEKRKEVENKTARQAHTDTLVALLQSWSVETDGEQEEERQEGWSGTGRCSTFSVLNTESSCFSLPLYCFCVGNLESGK